MAEILINMPDGTQTTGTVSDLALEKTQKDMLEILKKNFPKDVFKDMEKSMSDALDIAKDEAKNSKKSQEEADKDREKQLAALKKLAESGGEFTLDQDAVDRYNKAMARGEKIMTTAYSAIVGFTGAVVAAAGVALGAFIKGFLDVGNELNQLTGVGVGFVEMGDESMRATQALAKLSSKGIDAVAMMTNFSNVVATTSKGAFTEMTSAFMDATNAGVDFGMSLEDSVNRYGNELSMRQKLGAIDVATAAGRAAANKQIQTSITRQQQYSRALGVSTEELAEFSKAILQNTPVLAATLIRFSNDVRGKVTAGITDFASAMRGMGGEEGGNIAAAFTEAASMGAMGFSEEMTGYVRAVPSLAGPMNEYITAIQNGTLSQEQAAEMGNQITMSLGNLSAAEKNRVFALARAGDAQAVSMAKAITQFEQSERRLADINSNLTMEGVQTGTNTFNKILKEVTGMFDAFKYSFFAGVGSTDRFTDALNDAKQIIFDALGKAFKDLGGMGDVFGDLSGGAESFGEKVAEHLPKLITGVAEFVAGMIAFVPKLVNGFKSFFSVLSTIGTIIKLAVAPITIAFDFLSGVIEGVMIPLRLVGSIFSAIGAGIGYLWDGLSSGIEYLAEKFEGFGVVIDIIKYPFVKLGELLGWFAGLFESEGGSLAGTLGKLTGIVGIVLLAMKAFGSGIPGMIAGLGKSLLGGLGNVLKSVGGVLGKGLSKITGGLSDKVGGFLKSKLPGASNSASPAGDMGAKAMEKAGKASQRFTKTLADGMRDISKGIADLFTNLAKGVSNALTTLSKGLGNVVSNLASGISKAITTLSKGIAEAGKGVGKGIGALLQGTLTGLGKGLQALGNPKALIGSAALLVISGAMFVAAKAFEVFGNLNWEDVAKGFVALTGLGVLASVLGLALPFIIPGAIAIGALGVALIPFAIAANIAAPAIQTLFEGLASIKDVPISSMLALGPALIGMAVGMAALSAGGLISGLLDGLGKLFGAESPFDKIAKIGNAAPHIVAMADTMGNMDDTIKTFNESAKAIDSDSIRSHFTVMAEGVDRLNESMDNLSMVDLLKLAAMKAVTPQAEEEDTAKPTKVSEAEQERAEALQRIGADPNDVQMQLPNNAVANMGQAAKQNPLENVNYSGSFSEMKFAQNDSENYNKFRDRRQELKEEIDAEYSAEGSTMTRGQRAMRMQEAETQAREEFAPQAVAAGAAQYTNTDTGERIQFAQPAGPQGTAVNKPEEVATTEQQTTEKKSADNKIETDTQAELLAELLAETRSQNRLLKQQISTSKNIADQI